MLFALAGIAGGHVVVSAFRPGPVGQAVVLVRPLPGNAFSVRSGDTLVDLETESQLPFSDTVLDRVGPAPGQAVSPQVLRGRLSVKVVDNAEVVEISYRGGTSASAVSMASRVADAMLDVRTERAAAALSARASVLEVALATAENRLVAVSTSGEDAEAVAILGQRIVSLRNELRSFSVGQPNAGSVLATSAPRQSSARKLRLAVIASSVLVAGAAGYWFGGRVRGPRWVRPRRLEHAW